MANELNAVAQGDALTIYAVIRRSSDNLVWSVTASAFVAWVNADIGNYDISLVSASGDLYVGDFPTAITAGTVRVNYYQQAGGVPAITDLLLKSEQDYWNGTALVSQPAAVTATGCQLTDVATVKRYLELTVPTYDDLIRQLINQQSARVSRIVGRTFCATDYNEFTRLDEDGRFTTRQWPIIHVSRVAIGFTDAVSVDYTGSGIRAMMTVNETGVRLESTSAAGVKITTALAFALYPTFSTMATAISAVAGWAASLASASVDGLSSNLHRVAGLSLKQGAATERQSLTFPDFDTEFSVVDHDSGIIAIDSGAWGGWNGSQPLHRLSGQVLIEYRAGFETIPEDVAQVVVELVAGAFNRKGDKSSTSTQAQKLRSESIGDYSYTADDGNTAVGVLTSAAVEQSQLAGEHMSVLAPYMRVRVGGMW